MTSPSIEIDLPRRIDLAVAQDVAGRVRSALRNGHTHVILRFSNGAQLCSSEFIGYLVAVVRHLAAAGGSLTLAGLDEPNRHLLCRLGVGALLGIEPRGGAES